jgi:hypothetical protein
MATPKAARETSAARNRNTRHPKSVSMATPKAARETSASGEGFRIPCGRWGNPFPVDPPCKRRNAVSAQIRTTLALQKSDDPFCAANRLPNRTEFDRNYDKGGQ